MPIDYEKAIRFAHGEAATFSAAVCALASDLKSATLELTKGQREALALVMLKCDRGEIDGPARISWEHADSPTVYSLGDLLYTVE